jgi:5-formyltetrahydrofolate cyclo-ligase
MEFAVADEKKNLRAILRECRAALPASFAQSASARIRARLTALDAYRRARSIVLYAAIENEVATGALLDEALAAGRAVFLPRLDRGRNRLEVLRVDSPAQLAPGAYGIPEPAPDRPAATPAELAGALVCVPGLAFTPSGCRLGRGGGHYDRFLAEISPEAITIGLAYSFQLLDRVPQGPADRRLNLIVTESAIHDAGDAPHVASMRADGGGKPGWSMS